MTPDISMIIQEIVNQGERAVGSAMAIVLGGDGTAESFDGVPAALPLLTADFSPVPEPSSIVLSIMGLIGLVMFARRRRR